LTTAPISPAAIDGEAARKEAERLFHNARFGAQTDPRARVDRWYAAVEEGSRLQLDRLADAAAGRRILEYGCGNGAFSLEETALARIAGEYHGIDISDLAIEQAQLSLGETLREHCHFRRMDAERLAYPDDFFDLIFGRGIIHHLSVSRAYAEMARVLKPGGQASFFEPMGHNIAINLFRQRTPELRTSDEHPLLMGDLREARTYFRKVETRFYGLATLAAVPFTGKTRLPMRLCAALDRVLLKLPALRCQAWFVLMTLEK
jgi:ubiquinone/menaquinone biosynthesis C-methylase UbiE